MLQYKYRSLKGGKMTAVSRRPQKSKRDKNHRPFSGNAKKRYLKWLRLRSKGDNNFSHAGCPCSGCEYCNSHKRNMKLRKGFRDEWQYEYC